MLAALAAGERSAHAALPARSVSKRAAFRPQRRSAGCGRPRRVRALPSGSRIHPGSGDRARMKTALRSALRQAPRYSRCARLWRLNVHCPPRRASGSAQARRGPRRTLARCARARKGGPARPDRDQYGRSFRARGDRPRAGDCADVARCACHHRALRRRCSACLMCEQNHPAGCCAVCRTRPPRSCSAAIATARPLQRLRGRSALPSRPAARAALSTGRGARRFAQSVPSAEVSRELSGRGCRSASTRSPGRSDISRAGT